MEIRKRAKFIARGLSRLGLSSVLYKSHDSQVSFHLKQQTTLNHGIGERKQSFVGNHKHEKADERNMRVLFNLMITEGDTPDEVKVKTKLPGSPIGCSAKGSAVEAAYGLKE